LRIDGLGEYHPGSTGALNSALANRLGIDSPLEINLNTVSADGNMTITATVNSNEAIDSGHVIRFVIITKEWSTYAGSNDFYDYHYDFLDTAPNFGGIDFTIDANGTEEFSQTFAWDYTIQDMEVEWENAKAVVYVQNVASKEVLQSAWMTINPPAYNFIVSVEDQYNLLEPSSSQTSNIKIRNRGLETDTYNVEVTETLPTGWTYSFTTPSGTSSSSTTMEIPNQDEFISEVTINSGSNSSETAELTFTITSENETEIIEEYTLIAKSSAEILVINNSNDGAFGEYYENAIEAVSDKSFIMWDDKVNKFPVADLASLDQVKTIIMFGGNTLSDTTIPTEFKTFLDNGGNLLISGEATPNLFIGSDVQSYLGFDATMAYPGASSLQNTDVLNETILDLNFGGNECADNLENPVTFTVSDGELAFTYNNIPIRRAGIVKADANYKTMVLGFPFEAISTAEERSSCMELILNYFEPETSNEDDIIVSEKQLQILGNYPNPFSNSNSRNSSTSIRCMIPANTESNLEIFNMKGQLVKSYSIKAQNSARVENITWNGKDNTNKNVSSGVFFTKLTGSNTANVHKMLMIK
jgi:hypothetical protein